MRHILVHYHIFKNAGSSVEHLLRTSLGERWARLEGPHSWSIVTSDQVRSCLLRQSDLVALSSHQARLPLPAHPGWRILPIVILRHPLDRIASVYRFESGQGGSSPGSRMAEKSSLGDYIRWRLGESGGPALRDFQTVCLSAAQLEVEDPRDGRATERHLSSAKKFLRSLPVFGLVEEFAESIERFSGWLRPMVPVLDLAPTWKNVSQQADSSLEDRVREMRAEIGDTLYRALLEHNRLDLELYAFATGLFRRWEIDRDSAEVRR